MVKQEMPASVEQSWLFVSWPCVGPPLSSEINKRGMLAKLCMNADGEREKEKQCAVRQAWPLRPLETQGQLTQGTDK